MNQMKNVSQYPNTVSSANSVAKDASPDDAIFDIVKGVDAGTTMDSLFND